MRPRPRPLLVFGFVLAMVALWIAHSPPSPALSRALKDAEARLKEHYRRTPPPAGWTLTGVATRARQSEVWVDFAVAAAHPAVKAGKPYRALGRILSGLCPAMADPVWQLLSKRQEIELRALGDDRQVLLAVNCRAVKEAPGK
jgi:hypothetical protein